ncbi:hypothetical protein M9458_043944, partial [Cirrhinus mrigala]
HTAGLPGRDPGQNHGLRHGRLLPESQAKHGSGRGGNPQPRSHRHQARREIRG